VITQKGVSKVSSSREVQIQPEHTVFLQLAKQHRFSGAEAGRCDVHESQLLR
jgi:hypothetical protein